MGNTLKKHTQYLHRKQRVRRRILGTPERPRLAVYRSLNNLYAQIIDDTAGKTLLAESTLSKELDMKGGGNVKAAEALGAHLAKKAEKAGIKKVVFDRAGNLYHGRVKALAEALRKNGLEF